MIKIYGKALYLGLCTILSISASVLKADEVWKPSEWPVLKTYDSEHIARIALPLGGIGTGTVSLSGRGELCDWEIMNVPGKGYSTITDGNDAPFFCIYTRQGDSSQTTMLAGPLNKNDYEHYEGRPVNHHGLPRFATASFMGAYPMGQVLLQDNGLPVEVRIKGFNPFIPGDSERSGLPVAILSYEVTNLTDSQLEVAVCGSLRNFIGRDGNTVTNNWKGDIIPLGADKNRNTFREEQGLKGIYMDSEGVDPKNQAWGNMSLTTGEQAEVTYRTSSARNSWNAALLNFWDDFSEDGRITEQPASGENDPMASLAVKKTLGAYETQTFTFYLTWNFPNRKAWSFETVGNYYSQLYTDSWRTAQMILPQMVELEKGTLEFLNAFLGTTYPEVVKEAALSNLSVLRSQTVFRLPDGHMMGWEGIMDKYGSCKGSCTHVWNYEVATPYLFGDLARSMRDVEFNYATCPDGLMNFRAALPLGEAAKERNAAADGQMGCIMKMYREWQLSGDQSFLETNWAQVKKVLRFAWKERGWDGNKDGLMEGSQHNTMDVNYFGPNPQMQFWYLGALRAAEEMAVSMKDRHFADTCRCIFELGRAKVDSLLFNGEYYEHRITDPETFEYLDMTRPDVNIPDYQLGPGCLVDQLAGQYMSHLCGLGYLGEKVHMRTALESIWKYNYLPDFSRHFNNMRSYVLGNEAGLLMASWPKGRLEVPFPYFSEVMTGFEYCAATSMFQEGMFEEGLKVIQSIRDRYDGAKRNPFSEAECGYHYARSMASWAPVVALAEYSYSGIEQTMHITCRPGRYFWSNGSAWGTVEVTLPSVLIEVIHGTLSLKSLGIGEKMLRKRINLNAGESVRLPFGES
ncbi:MAG: GH116 family glycosyl-hydrolase [Candidatus Cryptobacteroides sp.]